MSLRGNKTASEQKLSVSSSTTTATTATTRPPAPAPPHYNRTVTYCQLCRRRVPSSDRAWLEHENGERHQSALAIFCCDTRVETINCRKRRRVDDDDSSLDEAVNATDCDDVPHHQDSADTAASLDLDQEKICRLYHEDLAEITSGRQPSRDVREIFDDDIFWCVTDDDDDDDDADADASRFEQPGNESNDNSIHEETQCCENDSSQGVDTPSTAVRGLSTDDAP